MFGGALPFFALFPTAPPRTLDGFVDTLGGHGTGLDHPLLVRFYNPIAAMPSHHVGFAVVTGIGLARRATTRASRIGWRTYPAVVAVVVIATANHFVADVIGGAVVGAVARESRGEREERNLSLRHMVIGVLAAAVAAVAMVAVIGRVAGFAEVRDSLADARFQWLIVCLLGQLLVFAGYAGAFRWTVRADGGPTSHCGRRSGWSWRASPRPRCSRSPGSADWRSCTGCCAGSNATDAPRLSG